MSTVFSMTSGASSAMNNMTMRLVVDAGWEWSFMIDLLYVVGFSGDVEKRLISGRYPGLGMHRSAEHLAENFGKALGLLGGESSGTPGDVAVRTHQHGA